MTKQRNGKYINFFEERVWNAGILRKLNCYAKNFRFFESELGTFVFYEKVYLCHATAGN